MSTSPLIPEEIETAASAWLARRDRGLVAEEQDAYLEWLYADPLHGRAIVQLERVWTAMNRLDQWRPAHSRVPNPDLLAPRRAVRFYRWSAGLAAAALVALALYAGRSTPAPSRAAIIHPASEKQTLADGSIVELNQGAKIAVAFTPGERRVQLLDGEAHFTVAHNAARPFFVDTGRVSVRAVGTAFSVTRAASAIGVLVTEGKVQLIESAATSGEPAAGAPVPPPIFLTAGQRAVVDLAGEAPAAPVVQEMTPTEVDRALSWQAMRLEFVDMPLRDVVAEFNRYNRRKLVVADPATADLLVAGNFRADNVDAFVRLLDAGFGITAFPHGDEIVLRKTP